MELKVWVEGIQRVVCGVCDRTTCQDVVYALAHATGKTGRFTLIERWRNNERLLAPHEHPLKVLMKWGEYSSDVHFILQRTALDATSPANKSNNSSSTIGRPSRTTVDPLHGFTPPPTGQTNAPTQTTTPLPLTSPSSSKDLKKSLTFSGGRPSPSTAPTLAADNNVDESTGRRQPPNVGVVRGVPKNILSPSSGLQPPPLPPPPLNDDDDDHVRDDDDDGYLYSPDKVTSGGGGGGGFSLPPPAPPPYYQSPDGPTRMVYPRYDPPGLARLTRQPPPSPLNVNVNNVNANNTYTNGVARYTPPPLLPPPPLDSPGGGFSDSSSSSARLPPPYRNPPQPFSTGSTPPNATTKPPPYREPPYPTGYRASPAPMTPSPGRSEADADTSRRPPVQLQRKLDVGREPSPPRDPQHAQLIQLVNRQRGGLDDQQERLVQLERELLHWEERLQRRLDQEQKNLCRELTQLEDRCRQQESQLTDLADVEDEWDRLNEEERQLREELERLRDDTSAIESQLDMHSSERLPALRNLVDERMAAELQTELTRIKGEVEAAGHLEEDLLDEERHLQEELAETEGRLQGIRAQMESLTNEIKQANLQSLSIAPADDLKVLLEGSHKSGHSRRMLGSPRQLENPLPTNKNPHGVWV